MARRRLLPDEQLATFWAWANDEREIVRHYTLTSADIELIAIKRTGPNRLGFAALLRAMRYPGRLLGVDEAAPAPVLAFIARQFTVTSARLTRCLDNWGLRG